MEIRNWFMGIHNAVVDTNKFSRIPAIHNGIIIDIHDYRVHSLWGYHIMNPMSESDVCRVLSVKTSYFIHVMHANIRPQQRQQSV